MRSVKATLIIVHGQHENDLLTTVFEIFKLNPKKSVIGLTRIEYVGHQIDAEGILVKQKQD